ncbi:MULTISPECIES: T9SS type B sorting domain-containing protein [Niastella]|uniref:Gliding motility-associated C-terminal domain-containing protein n=1 Tax=Niastella soli TaxID=2821487 RepID=A0ABS3YZL2_9BACT|nr:T9SS type B sorting domain-containing protein [Niastella soli]MBO9202947.1 gliding motility-associated C-terminal domain-containing protein [Niastella soli]
MKKYLLCFAAIFIAVSAFCQMQTCPTNINFGTGDLSFWSATTGLMNGPTQSYPAPNTGLTSISEYSISNTGIQVITSSTSDPFGFFPTVPTINGYAYNYSIMLGSTATSRALGQNGRNPGGFTRAVTYTINVPPGSVSDPYTMTYAYAMVLENGTHNSNEQPLFKATLSTHDSIITCASPGYYLPTFNNAAGGNGGSGTGATLDSAAAKANGFTNSPVPFMNFSGNNSSGTLLYDVWTKGWTEVTFDLSPYRGQQVSLTFEADNCRPGAHFAYAYVALRNTCAGLEISGKQIACTNTTVEYSVPALAGATYDWTVPAGWTIISGANSNIINVMVGANGGKVTSHEVNGCADLRDTIDITTKPPTVAGRIMSDTTICSGINSVPLSLTDEVGSVVKWVASTDGVSWREIAVTNDKYTAQNLLTSTRYAALVQNGPACNIDTSVAAFVTVDPKSNGGKVSPDLSNVCLNENTRPLLSLIGYTGGVMNWQSSVNNASWNSFSPAYPNPTFQAGPITQTMYYRAVVKSGVCPADTSDMATIKFFNVPAPAATIDPENISICYGTSTVLNATITTGTNYTWSNNVPLAPGGSGVVPSLPYSISSTASPKVTSNVVLSVTNAGCPNPLKDTFHIDVTKPIIVNAGNDTAVVINQPLQFNATVNDPNANRWSWNPPTGLNFVSIPNPIGMYNETAPAAITYVVKAETAAGCNGTDTITVKIFKTGADIFMPSGFTPNGDGHNDVIRPIMAGIKQLIYFRVYNRWGQLVFSTSEVNKGWDGNLGGSQQSSQNFVYMVQAIDYTGKTIVKRGSFVLVR